MKQRRRKRIKEQETIQGQESTAKEQTKKRMTRGREAEVIDKTVPGLDEYNLKAIEFQNENVKEEQREFRHSEASENDEEKLLEISDQEEDPKEIAVPINIMNENYEDGKMNMEVSSGNGVQQVEKTPEKEWPGRDEYTVGMLKMERSSNEIQRRELDEILNPDATVSWIPMIEEAQRSREVIQLLVGEENITEIRDRIWRIRLGNESKIILPRDSMHELIERIHRWLAHAGYHVTYAFMEKYFWKLNMW